MRRLINDEDKRLPSSKPSASRWNSAKPRGRFEQTLEVTIGGPTFWFGELRAA
jgi:hypothetical protein